MEHIEIDESRLEAEVKAITQNANLDDVTVKDLRTRVEQVLGVAITDKNMFAGIVKRVLSQASQVGYHSFVVFAVTFLFLVVVLIIYIESF
jgi:hypothetical protein